MILRVRALIQVQDHLLLCRYLPTGAVFFPGGRVDEGETLLQALARELKEETNAELVAAEYLGAMEAIWSFTGDKIHDLSHFFSVECIGLDRKVAPSCHDEGIELFWCTAEDLPTLNLQPQPLRELLMGKLNGKSLPWWRMIHEDLGVR